MSRIARTIGARNVPLILALLLGGATFAGVLTWLPGMAGDGPTDEVETVAVLVAADDLAAGEKLEDKLLQVVQVPPSTVAAGALTSTDAAAGQVLRYPVSAGEQILASKLVGSERPDATGLAFVVPSGMRAVSVPISEVTSAGGLIVPGDRVDVLAAVKDDIVLGSGPDAPNAQDPEANDYEDPPTAIVTVLQDALVLAVGQAVSDQTSVSRDAGAQRADDAEADPKAASVTLAVTPEQAQTLFMAVTEGSIGLTLRSFGDTSRATLQPIIEVAPAAGEASQVSAP